MNSKWLEVPSKDANAPSRNSKTARGVKPSQCYGLVLGALAEPKA
jgi:hypothetical protein